MAKLSGVTTAAATLLDRQCSPVRTQEMRFAEQLDAQQCSRNYVRVWPRESDVQKHQRNGYLPARKDEPKTSQQLDLQPYRALPKVQHQEGRRELDSEVILSGMDCC